MPYYGLRRRGTLQANLASLFYGIRWILPLRVDFWYDIGRMAFSQSDLDKLDAAIADGRGVRQISFQDQSLTFNSVADMLKLRSVIKREVDSTPNYRLAVTDKGT